MPLLKPPLYSGFGKPCLDSARITVHVDLGYSGSFYAPWYRRSTATFLRACARIKARNIDHVTGVKPIPGRAKGLAGVYKVRLLGTYACRAATCCPGQWSNHAWPLAVDINWDTNPFHGSTKTWGPHDMPQYFIDAFQAEGFYWLAQYDPMHFERITMDNTVLPPGQTGPLFVDYKQFLTPPPPPPPGGFMADLTDAEQHRILNFIDGAIAFLDKDPNNVLPTVAGNNLGRALNVAYGIGTEYDGATIGYPQAGVNFAKDLKKVVAYIDSL